MDIVCTQDAIGEQWNEVFKKISKRVWYNKYTHDQPIPEKWSCAFV